MAWYEDRDTQSKRHWKDRLAQERLNISESVEETMSDISSQEQWSDDEQMYIPEDTIPSRAELVPPRLSLQSKVLPSVRPASFVQSVTAEIAAQEAAAKAKEEPQKPHSTNILTRFAQRFTSSLAAFGASIQPDTPMWVSSTPNEQDDALSEERQLVPRPKTYAPIEGIQMPLATVVDAIPATPSTVSPQPVKSKQRLAGHTAKVHLQNAPASKAPSQPQERDAHNVSRERWEPIREPLTINVRLREKVQEAAVSDLPVVATVSHEELHKSSSKRQVKQRATVTTDTSMAPCFGTGTFESGHSEVMVRNAQTAASSVVHVTLTSNPGPTLVQYVSLHPEVGFTLHLTAPATAKTTFNYVLFTDVAVQLS